MRTACWLLLLTGAVLITVSVLSQRSSGTATATAAKVAIEGVPVGTVREIMKGMVDPNAEIVWGAVGIVHEKQGTTEKEPRSEEEWTSVENGAMALAEVANLLKMPGRQIARPDEANTMRWPEATMTPTQIEERLEGDRVPWDKSASALQAAAMKALTAARAHDKDRVFNVGEEIDNACESCHVVYWYPVEKTPAVLAPAARVH